MIVRRFAFSHQNFQIYHLLNLEMLKKGGKKEKNGMKNNFIVN